MGSCAGGVDKQGHAKHTVCQPNTSLGSEQTDTCQEHPTAGKSALALRKRIPVKRILQAAFAAVLQDQPRL